MPIPNEDLHTIARILAAGYIRWRYQRRIELPLDCPPGKSGHGHTVDKTEKGERFGRND